MLNYNSIDTSNKEEQDAGKMNVVTFLRQKLLQENNFRKNYVICPLLPEPLILGEIWELTLEIVFKDLTNVHVPRAVALLVSKLCAGLSKMLQIGKIWPLMTSGELTLDLT